MKAGLLIIIYATSNSGSQFNNFNFLHLENFGISSTRKSGKIIVMSFNGV